MRIAGAQRAIVALRPGKWDIPAHLGDGAFYELPLAYTVVADSPGVPWSVRSALRFASGERVLFGFPDIVFRPADALARVEQRQRDGGAELVLGAFPARRPEKMDMVALSPEGVVRQLIVKPQVTTLRYTWILAIWTPRFSAFLDTCIQKFDASSGHAGDNEVHFGHIIRAALAAGWRIDAVEINDGSYFDIGTPDDLTAALDEFG